MPNTDAKIEAVYRELGSLSGEMSRIHRKMADLCDELASLQAVKLLEGRLPNA